ncbi:hypothetical protein GAYE_SCF42G5560 [Galdieria yellowstonensis]|uniref:Uncharacterized protein n=1 Tax=Galdieria yellowstonensis TaxID=3028027 RepID=A0AAV9IJX6_9RHOD|nr:hypothetical protein GAYE_SCF42G5560 [Galdieria yellowstonensis]
MDQDREDPFEKLAFLEDQYFAQGKSEGIRYLMPASRFQGFLTGLEERFTFVAFVERHQAAAELILQLRPLLPAQAFDFDALNKYAEELRSTSDDAKLFEDAETRKHIYKLCQRIQNLLKPIEFIENKLFAESELSF